MEIDRQKLEEKMRFWLGKIQIALTRKDPQQILLDIFTSQEKSEELATLVATLQFFANKEENRKAEQACGLILEQIALNRVIAVMRQRKGEELGEEPPASPS